MTAIVDQFQPAKLTTQERVEMTSLILRQTKAITNRRAELLRLHAKPALLGGLDGETVMVLPPEIMSEDALLCEAASVIKAAILREYGQISPYCEDPESPYFGAAI